jgi:hypothetical protein
MGRMCWTNSQVVRSVQCHLAFTAPTSIDVAMCSHEVMEARKRLYCAPNTVQTRCGVTGMVAGEVRGDVCTWSVCVWASEGKRRACRQCVCACCATSIFGSAIVGGGEYAPDGRVVGAPPTRPL